MATSAAPLNKDHRLQYVERKIRCRHYNYKMRQRYHINSAEIQCSVEIKAREAHLSNPSGPMQAW